MAWVMSTIGFGIILQNIGAGDLGPEPSPCRPRWATQVIRFGGAGVRPQELLMLGVAALVMIGARLCDEPHDASARQCAPWPPTAMSPA